MAAVVSLAAMLRGSGRLCSVFAGFRKTSCASGAVISWRRECSSQSPQVSSQEDMPVAMENPYKEPPKKCILCGMTLDYKNIQLLSQFVSPYTGRIFGRHITGLCEKKQSELSKAIRRARKTGFMSVTYKDPTFLSDPKICNIKYPE
ncbi:small ribosomal subunit protein bS18m [Anolis carolinensis]|uniref:Small ribosomal subunit protein bS18m n=1 Tax=Anolis carolinensis TaxID=28377 RepID=G1KKN1_ANOCA|nr:PREDICTED: 28S ribosomal protein S18c, mitochondrial [Anolis carolinensis]|eukprot:XP_008109215.1 PREDICTED: 28S ribosomal protein S18c, mitochondrial [Anolis carolinensis]